MNKIVLLFLSFFNVGRFKYAPGTIASIFACVIWYNIPDIFLTQFIFIVSFLTLSSSLCFYYSIKIKKDDPSFIVLDEICGMSIALFMIPKSYILYFISFVIFRFFDIVKPLYINKIQKIDYGMGIMLDDVIAGLYTLIIVKLIIFYI